MRNITALLSTWAVADALQGIPSQYKQISLDSLGDPFPIQQKEGYSERHWTDFIGLAPRGQNYVHGDKLKWKDVLSQNLNVTQYPALASSPYDWLFNVKTKTCTGDGFDNTPSTIFSRVFLPLLFLFCLLMIFLSSTISWEGSESELNRHTDEIIQANSTDVPSTGSVGLKPGKPDSGERLWHLDFARIAAVMCVIFEHSGGEAYTHRNVGFGLWWALPFLYMTSGMGCMMSKSGMSTYVLRLVVVLIVGISANWIADIITHRAWRTNFPNTIFQMFFVVMLVGMAIFVEPLRLVLRHRKETPAPCTTRMSMISLCVWGVMTICGFLFFLVGASPLKIHGGGGWKSYYAPMTDNVPIILVEIGGLLFLATLGCMIASSSTMGYTGWVLILFIYLPNCIIPFDFSGFPHLITLYILAMVTTAFPLAGTPVIAKVVRAYWPFLLMFLCFLTMPDMWGRCDVNLPNTLWERIRFDLGELSLTICFVTGAFKMDDPYKVTVWMGYWALYAYCFHVAWYRLFGVPYGAVVSLGSIVVFWALFRMSQSSKGASSDNVPDREAA